MTPGLFERNMDSNTKPSQAVRSGRCLSIHSSVESKSPSLAPQQNAKNLDVTTQYFTLEFVLELAQLNALCFMLTT